MSTERSFKERAAESFDAFKERINMEEARRLALNGKRYVKTHPVTAVVVSLAAGILVGYAAKAIVDRRRSAETHAGA
jgi:ElaB/YqjD/DUF883 family membrane-anchored ribosome-binding protein